MACGVYKLTAPSGKCYVGSSRNVGERLIEHSRKLRGGRHPNKRLQGAFRKYGPLKEEILLVCRREDMIFYEQLVMDAYKPAYNRSRIAGGNWLAPESLAKIIAANTGRKASPETRAKMSAAGKGRPKSPETRAKMSAASLGKPKSAEARANMSLARKGEKRKPRTPEHQEKIAAVHRGKMVGVETRAKISAARKRYFLAKSEGKSC